MTRNKKVAGIETTTTANRTAHRRHSATEATAPSYEEEMERDEEGLMEHWCRFIC